MKNHVAITTVFVIIVITMSGAKSMMMRRRLSSPVRSRFASRSAVNAPHNSNFMQMRPSTTASTGGNLIFGDVPDTFQMLLGLTSFIGNIIGQVLGVNIDQNALMSQAVNFMVGGGLGFTDDLFGNLNLPLGSSRVGTSI